jgi:hypothetical protein
MKQKLNDRLLEEGKDMKQVICLEGPKKKSLYSRLGPSIKYKAGQLQGKIDELFLKYKDIEDERLLGIICSMCVELALDVLLESYIKNYEIFKGTDRPTAFDLKIRLLRALNIIPEHIIRPLELIKKIRNKFAHDLEANNFDVLEEKGQIKGLKEQIIECIMPFTENYFRSLSTISTIKDHEEFLDKINNFNSDCHPDHVSALNQNELKKLKNRISKVSNDNQNALLLIQQIDNELKNKTSKNKTSISFETDNHSMKTKNTVSLYKEMIGFVKIGLLSYSYLCQDHREFIEKDEFKKYFNNYVNNTVTG